MLRKLFSLVLAGAFFVGGMPSLPEVRAAETTYPVAAKGAKAGKAKGKKGKGKKGKGKKGKGKKGKGKSKASA